MDLWGDDAPAAAAAPDVAEALSRFVEAELLSDSARAAPPLPAAELQRLTAALEAVLHPSVRRHAWAQCMRGRSRLTTSHVRLDCGVA